MVRKTGSRKPDQVHLSLKLMDDLLLYGGGGQSKSFYNNLREDSEIEILWAGWCGPKWSSFLSFIPGQAGLLKVLNQGRLKTLYEDLASHSVSDLYYVPKKLTEKIRQEVMSAPSSHDSKKILEHEMSFIYMQCEMDETVLTNGVENFLIDIAMGKWVCKLNCVISSLQ